MFVCIEIDEIFNTVNNVYGPFPALEAAEEFRSKRKNKADYECYLLQSPEEIV